MTPSKLFAKLLGASTFLCIEINELILSILSKRSKMYAALFYNHDDKISKKSSIFITLIGGNGMFAKTLKCLSFVTRKLAFEAT